MVLVCTDSITKTIKGKKSKGFYMHRLLKENIDYEIERVNKKWDCVIVYDGEEGSGKTTLAVANAYYMSKAKGMDFSLDNVIYTIKQFNKLVDELPPHSNIVWDEFVMSGLNLEALSKMQIALIKKMAMMRKKQLVVHLVIPYIFMLTKYFAIGRARALVHVYSRNNLDRGDFMYYSKPKKRFLMFKGAKYWDYYSQKPDFLGDFTNTEGLFFDMDQYEKKKDKAIELITHDRRKDQAGFRILKIIDNLSQRGWSQRKIAEAFGFRSKGSLYDYIKRYELLEKEGYGRAPDRKPSTNGGKGENDSAAEEKEGEETEEILIDNKSLINKQAFK